MHLFNENFPSPYITKKAGSDTCAFFTLPFVDGYSWSTKEKIAGLRFKMLADGKEISLEGGDPMIQDSIPGRLHISWPLKFNSATLVMDLDEKQIKMKLEGGKSLNWILDMTAADNASLPYKKISADRMDCRFEGMDYQVKTESGSFSKPGNGAVFRITPEENTIVLNLSGNDQSR